MSVPELAPAAGDSNVGLVTQGAGRRWSAAVILIALAGFGLVLLSTARYGAGLYPDSVSYLDVARSLVSGKGFVFHNGEPLVWWPPLYPMLFALVGFVTGLDPAAFVHLVNAALFALVIYLSARLFRTGLQQDATYSVLGVCAVLLSIPLSEVYAMAWSECLFIPLVLLSLLFAQRYRDGGSMLSLALMALSAALACLTRYIGVAFVAAGVATILLASGAKLKTRLVRAILFAACSLAPLALWLARNFRLAGTFSGERFHPGFELVTNVVVLAMTAVSWFEPVGMAARLLSASAAQAAKSASLYANLFVALAGAIALTTTLLLSRTARKRISCSLKAVLSDCLPTVLFLAVYSLALLVLAARGASSFVDHRLLSPVYVPATLILLKLAHDLLGPSRPAPTVTANKVSTILLALWLCFPLASVARSTAARYKNGAGGYSTRSWHESETVTYARQMLSACDDAHVYSNGADVLWELARVNARQLPRRAEVNVNGLKGRWPAANGSVLVWFDSLGWRGYLLSIEELGEVADLVEIARFSDGSIYRVSTREAAMPSSGRQVSGAASRGGTTTLESMPDERR